VLLFIAVSHEDNTKSKFDMNPRSHQQINSDMVVIEAIVSINDIVRLSLLVFWLYKILIYRLIVNTINIQSGK
jgi:hypothetical protein